MPCLCGKHNTERGCRGAQAFARRSRAQRQADGRLGGIAQAAKWHARLVSRFDHLRRADAIVAAWQLGLHTRKLRGYRAQKRGAA